MYKFDEILIALDLSRTDENLIRYGFGAGDLLDAKEIILMHVSSRNLQEAAPDGSGKTLQETIEAQIQAMAAPFAAQYPHIKLVVEVESGDPLTAMLKASKEQKVDLIVVGRKSVGQGSGKVARELARRALCSVFSVPFNAKLKFDRLVMPIDYSEFSEMAMRQVLEMAHKRPSLEVVPLSIYSLPQGYLQSGKTEEEFAEIMLANTEKRFQHFIKQFDTSGVAVRPRYQLDTKNFLGKIIFNVALVEEADLIIIGSKGRTTIAAAFLGSTTEKLLKQNMVIPTLVLKKREGNLGFFEALLNI
jgi:nucleotide-binding universal stress UspA family protein